MGRRIAVSLVLGIRRDSETHRPRACEATAVLGDEVDYGWLGRAAQTKPSVLDLSAHLARLHGYS